MEKLSISFSKVPTIRQWAKVCVAVFGYLMSERSNENNHLASLAANLDLDMKFSDAWVSLWFFFHKPGNKCCIFNVGSIPVTHCRCCNQRIPACIIYLDFAYLGMLYSPCNLTLHKAFSIFLILICCILFSRCRKVLPVASSAYLDNLPSHYPESVHINQVVF